jgi:conjugal transfer mating pair stabilization protein TraN
MMKHPFLIENADLGPEKPISLWRKATAVLLKIILVVQMFNPAVMQSSQAAECVKTGTVCAEGAATRNINGTNVYKSCWRYEDSYSCTTVQGVKACSPLANTAGCGQTYTNCLEKGINGECIKFTKNYTCNKDFKAASGGTLINGITELPATHEIISSFDEAACNAATSQFTACKMKASSCVKGVETKTINGVQVSFPCWEEERSYECLGKLGSTCDDIESNGLCSFKKATCLNWVNGECQTGENAYNCQIKAGETSPSDTCKDKDFGKVMAGLEGAREFGRYFDEDTMTFFKGENAKCTIKLSGSIGGDCCKAAGDPNKWTDAAVQYGVQAAASYASSLASSYTFTVLLGNVGATAGGVAASIGATTEVAAAVGSKALSVGVTSTGNTFLIVSPAAIVAAIVVMVIMNWLACDPEEKKTALRNKAGLCVHSASYCQSEVLGACITKAQSYCCYVSKLARIINVQGREQINKPFVGGVDDAGNAYTPERPNCTGFNQKELEGLDFSKMDLTEFIADIVHTTPDNQAITDRAISDAEKKTQQAADAAAKGTYYGQP